MSAHTSEDVKKHLRLYIGVFVALLAGTLLTVWAWTWHFESVAVTVALAMFIATIKAFLVAGYFMHLMSEKKTVYAILLTTVFFFVGMMFLIVWSRDEMPRGTVYFGDRPTTAETKH
jgi:cytochrome c oxidase subunit 4